MAASVDGAPTLLLERLSVSPAVEDAHRWERTGVGRVQRGRILTAAIGVVTVQGAAETTVAAIVARAGVSRRTFYELFDSAEDCLLAAIEESLARARHYLERSYEPARPWATRIRAGLEALLQFFDAERTVARLLVVETLSAGPRVLEARACSLAPLIAAVDAGREEARPNAAVTPLTAEAVVGAVLAVLHARISDGTSSCLGGLAGELMSIIVLPYRGATEARRELERPASEPSVARLRPNGAEPATGRTGADGSEPFPFERLPMRVTFRTVCVLRAVAEQPGASNSRIGRAAGIVDQGQISKLLARLARLGLAANERDPSLRGQPNAWRLTGQGLQIVRAIEERPGRRVEGGQAP